MFRRTAMAAGLLFAACSSVFGARFVSGHNTAAVRGQKQDVYYYPAAASAGSRGTILFTPGDGGWRGAAIDMARKMAASGYDVYGWDTKKYLRSFTQDQATLTEDDIARDFLAMRSQIVSAPSERVILVGWSQGAAMSLLPASRPAARDYFAGVVAIGLPEHGVLGWRWKDDLTYVTKQEPDEPKFETAGPLGSLGQVPLVVVQASDDEYTPVSRLEALYRRVRGPKKLLTVAGSKHNFSGHETEFYARLGEALETIERHGLQVRG